MNTENEEDYKKLSNQPLLFVLAEFRFSDVRNIEEYIPKLQEKFRRNFPFIEEQSGQEVNINPQGVNVTETKQWSFISKDKRNAIVLSYNRMVYMTSNYDRFDGFKEACEMAIDVLITEVAPSLLIRIGLRYANLIVKNNDEDDITSYVEDSVCEKDFLRVIGDPKHQIKEILIETEEGLLNIRSMYTENNLSFWNDTENSPVKIARKDQSSERILLDFDHFWQPDKEEDSLNFEKNIIVEKLEKMHKPGRRAFWQITTRIGRKVWE